ncbi:MAG: alpha/beta hydrolase family protein [Defluviitaleaceae bacterium]|nr:alpha/beta hydrolase family protein [Defluviitaleaceae bacterium]
MKLTDENGFYTSVKQMERLFLQGCTKRFTGTTPAELAAWQAEARELLRDLLGFGTFEGCADTVYELDSEDCGEYVRTKYVLQTEEYVYTPFFTLIPADLKPGERRPAIICPNGHFNRAKESVAAVRHEEGVLEDMENAHTHHAEDFVRRGYIAFCPDARGFGERAEKAVQDKWHCSCAHLNRMGIPLGRSALGMQVWDLIKLADYIETRGDCDPSRITCAGLSGGGMQTLYFAAVDTRIKCACTSGYFFGALESRLHGNHHCDCNYVPNLWKYFDMGDIAALIAPRPFIIETGLHDDSNGIRGIENVYDQVRVAQKAYDAAGYADKLKHSVLDVGHRWVGTDVYPFFDKHV